MPRYWVLRGEQVWHIYRQGYLAFKLEPKAAKAILRQLAAYGCQVAFGD